MKKVFIFSSENDENVEIGLKKKKWAYTKSTRTHGDIQIGDYVLFYSKESKCVLGAGMVKTLPRIGYPIKIWGNEYWDAFSFDLKSKNRIPLESIKRKLNIDNATKTFKLLFANACSDLTARQALQIIKMKG